MKIQLVTLILACFCCYLPLHAQEFPNLRGVILNETTGLPLSDAHVTLSPSVLQTVTDPAGHFRFYGVTAGSYSITVTHLGFLLKEQSGIIIQPGIPVDITVRLKPRIYDLPGVTVASEALPTAGLLSGGQIIGRQQLSVLSAGSVAEALQITGLATISSDGAPGGRQTVSLRGSASNQVLILVDGVPLNPASDGTADLSLISTSEIQQIEVYPQAPASLGAQAIGGAINIVTLDPGEERSALRLTLSEYGERQAALTLGRRFKSWSVLGIFEHKESQGEYRYRVVADDGLDLFTRNFGETYYRQNADYRRDYVSLKVNPPGRFVFGAKFQSMFRHNPDYLPEIELEHEAVTKDTREEISLDYNGSESKFMPDIFIKAEGYHQEAVTDYGEAYPVLYNETSIAGEAYSMNLDWQRTIQSWSDVQFGSGVRWERVWSDDIEEGEQERLHEFGYFQAQGNPLEELILPLKIGIFGGVRADLYRHEETFIHPKLGIEIGSGSQLYWKLRAEMAGAYRLPSFNSLFWKEDLQSEGNPDLKPERSNNREYSLAAGWNGVEASISYFDRDITDLIYWRLDFDNRWKPLNISSAWIYGLDYKLRVKSPWKNYSSNLTLSHQWLNAVNTSGEPNTDGKSLIYRPENSTTLAVNQNLHYCRLDLAARWVDERFTTEANTKSLSPYTLWDVGVTKTFSIKPGEGRILLGVRVTNLFDTDYRIVQNAPTSLREFWFTTAFEQN
ncbi:TonB-dependent receptor [bacterium]|nr:TonB-dependent receptor [bacterium]